MRCFAIVTLPFIFPFIKTDSNKLQSVFYCPPSADDCQHEFKASFVSYWPASFFQNERFSIFSKVMLEAKGKWGRSVLKKIIVTFRCFFQYDILYFPVHYTT